MKLSLSGLSGMLWTGDDVVVGVGVASYEHGGARCDFRRWGRKVWGGGRVRRLLMLLL